MTPWQNAERMTCSRNRGRVPKGLVLFWLFAFFALTCAGCGKENKPAGTVPPKNDATGNVAEQSAGPESTPSPKEDPEDFIEAGFSLIKNESIGPLKYGLSESDLATRFGQPEEKTEAVVWGADGLFHQTWRYRSLGIELDLVRNTEPGADTGIEAVEFTVDMITVVAPFPYRTSRGAGIGTSQSEVLLLYADEIDPHLPRDPNMIIAGSAYGGIIFYLRSNRVFKIFIGAAAE